MYCPFPSTGGFYAGMDTVSIGTGTVVSNYQIVTAAHVVDCKSSALPAIHATLRDGRMFRMSIQDIDDDDDLVRLEMMSGGKLGDSFHPPLLGPFPDIGSDVCLEHAAPDRGRTCGKFIGPHLGALHHDAKTRSGNSGSPTFDSTGKLIGIEVSTWLCGPDGRPCGGIAVPLPAGWAP